MIVGSYLGESASKLIKQTEAALRCGGLVLEEIDALAMQRGGETSASHENSRITIALMHLIENATAPVIFTTNRIDIIDPAVVRRCETVQFAEPLLDVKWRILVRRLGLDPHDAPEIRDRWPDLLRRDIKLGKYSLPTTQLSRPIVELVPLAHIARRRAALHGSDVLSTFAELLSQEPQS
jgi:SpoVK/Ycf46/Vps4 family AAA+-type ATPase